MRLLWLLAGLFCAPALAAITHVAGINANSGSGSGDGISITISEPSGAANGDYMLLACSAITNTDGTWSATDWTPLATKVSNGSQVFETTIWGRFRGASAGNLTASFVGGTASNRACVIEALRGVDPTTPIDVTYVEGTHYIESLNAPNTACRAITTVTDGAWVILHQTISQSITTFGAPSGYTIRANNQGTNSNLLLMTREIASAGTETPGAGTHTPANGTNEDPRCFTFAVRPYIESPDDDHAMILRRRRQ